jgi:hypothetical protein
MPFKPTGPQGAGAAAEAVASLGEGAAAVPAYALPHADPEGSFAFPSALSPDGVVAFNPPCSVVYEYGLPGGAKMHTLVGAAARGADGSRWRGFEGFSGRLGLASDDLLPAAPPHARPHLTPVRAHPSSAPTPTPTPIQIYATPSGPGRSIVMTCSANSRPPVTGADVARGLLKGPKVFRLLLFGCAAARLLGLAVGASTTARSPGAVSADPNRSQVSRRAATLRHVAKVVSRFSQHPFKPAPPPPHPHPTPTPPPPHPHPQLLHVQVPHLEGPHDLQPPVRHGQRVPAPAGAAVRGQSGGVLGALSRQSRGSASSRASGALRLPLSFKCPRHLTAPLSPTPLLTTPQNPKTAPPHPRTRCWSSAAAPAGPKTIICQSSATPW